MKRFASISLVIMTLLMVGCMNSSEKKIKEYENLMQQYSEDYFKNYGVSNGLDIYEVTIDMLEKANDSGISNYDLDKLTDCKKSSKALIYLKEDSKKIEKYEYELDCDI